MPSAYKIFPSVSTLEDTLEQIKILINFDTEKLTKKSQSIWIFVYVGKYNKRLSEKVVKTSLGIFFYTLKRTHQ
jgi:hypothetical protein